MSFHFNEELTEFNSILYETLHCCYYVCPPYSYYSQYLAKNAKHAVVNRSW